MLLIYIVEKLFLIFTIMLFVRIIASWIPEIQGQRWMHFIVFYTDPYLNFFRRFIPPLGMFDLSPIVAFLCLSVMEQAIKFFLISILS
ncbi:MAG: YggT family protein [Parachlamydiaceae bacterium]